MPEQPPAPTFTRRTGAEPFFSARARTFLAARSVIVTMGSSELLGLPAAAGSLLDGVLDAEARTKLVLGVIDGGLLDEGQALRVDDDVEAVLGEDLVGRALVVEGDLVLVAGAAGRGDLEAQGLALDRLLGLHEILDLLGGFRRDGEHRRAPSLLRSDINSIPSRPSG